MRVWRQFRVEQGCDLRETLPLNTMNSERFVLIFDEYNPTSNIEYWDEGYSKVRATIKDLLKFGKSFDSEFLIVRNGVIVFKPNEKTQYHQIRISGKAFGTLYAAKITDYPLFNKQVITFV